MVITIGVPSIESSNSGVKEFITFGLTFTFMMVTTSGFFKLDSDGIWSFEGEPSEDFFKMDHFSVVGLFFFYEDINRSFSHIVHSNSSSVATIMGLNGDKN
jgi:hypothetical protein